MKKFLFITFTVFLFVGETFSQYEAIGARSAATGDASVSYIDTWSTFNNPSALGFTDKIQMGFSYKNNFLMKELSQMSFAFSLPVKKVGVFHLGVDRFGYDQFASNKFGIGYSRKFGKIFSLGTQINLHWIHIGDIYGNKVTASGSVSFLVKPMKNWNIGVNVYNITATPISIDARDRINTIFRLGTSYLIGGKFMVSVEGEASLQYDPTFKAGIDYRPIPLLAIRAGINTYPMSPTFGFGIDYKKINFDFAGKWHPVLGFSPIGSLSYSFGK
jgi:hypothetical protein